MNQTTGSIWGVFSFSMTVVIVVIFYLDSHGQSRRALLESHEIGQQVEILKSEFIASELLAANDRLATTEQAVGSLEARVNILLEASEEENVRTVMLALQRFNDFSSRVERTEKRIETIDDRLWNIIYWLGAGFVGGICGIVGIFFKEELKRWFARKSAEQSPAARDS